MKVTATPASRMHSKVINSKMRVWAFAIICLSLAFPAVIQADSAPEKEPLASQVLLQSLDEKVQRITLSNGLRVVVYPRSQAPVFTGQIWVKVGSVDEVPGVTGVSHMLEHMAFKGSTRIGTKDHEREKELLEEMEALLDAGVELESTELKALRAELETLWETNEFSRLYQTRGATGLNAGTGKDYTVYMVSVPTTAFELWCWLESDRLLNPVFRQFYKERDVVAEERRMRVDDSPSGKLYEQLLSIAYIAHPNRLPTVGWSSDINSLRVADIEKLYAEYYRPDNMVVALVGDLDAEEITPMLEKYFGRIPRAKAPLPKVRTVEPPQEGPRHAKVSFEASPRLMMAYHKPVYPHPDDMQFMILHALLSESRTSILYRELVQRRRIASSIFTSEAPGELYPSLFIVGGAPSKGVSNEELVTAIEEILESIKTKPFSKEDIEAAKKRIKVDLVTLMSSNYGLARTLGRIELLWGDWQKLFEMYDQAFATDAEDLMRLANRYFTSANQTVVVLDSGEEQ